MKHVITGTDDEGDRTDISVENDQEGIVELGIHWPDNPGSDSPLVALDRDELRTALFLLDKEEAGEL